MNELKQTSKREEKKEENVVNKIDPADIDIDMLDTFMDLEKHTNNLRDLEYSQDNSNQD